MTLIFRNTLLLRNIVVGLGLVMTALSVFAQQASLAVGDPAPDFSLLGSDKKTYSLADYKGKQAVALAFFPKAFTGG